MNLLTNFLRNRNAHFRAAVKAAKILNNHDYEAFMIGGAVRDMLLGKMPKDFDLVTNATPDQVMAIEDFEHALYTDSAQAFGVTRIKIPIFTGIRRIVSTIEVTTYRRDIEAHLGRKATKIEFSTLKDDVIRRDFTINAIAYDPSIDQMYDLVDGIEDIKHKILRFIGSPQRRIQEDPLRVIRGIRLKNQLGLSYDPATKQAIAAAIKHGEITKIAIDRFRTEINRMLQDVTRVDALIDLDTFGVIEMAIPELAAMRGVEQPRSIHAEGTVWTHTLLAMRYLPKKPSLRLVWATLLHDIAKPVTKTDPSSTEDRIHFYQHAEIGADMSRVILQRLNCSKQFIEEVQWMVRYHLGIDDLPKMRPGRQASIMSHPAFSDLMELHRADAHAAWSTLPNGRIDRSAARFPDLDQIWQTFRAIRYRRPPTLKRKLGIDGHWLQDKYDLHGKKLGETLTALNEAFLDGEIKSKSDADRFVRQLINNR